MITLLNSHSLILFLLFFLTFNPLVYAFDCFYSIEGAHYDLSYISTFDYIWAPWGFLSISVCDPIFDAPVQCGSQSSVCWTMNNGTSISLANLFTTSLSGGLSANPIVAQYVGQTCRDSLQYTTTLYLYCNEETFEITSIIFDQSQCQMYIYIQTSHACELAYSSNSDDDPMGMDPFLFVSGVFLMLLIVICCLVCCCIVKKRNTNRPFSSLPSPSLPPYLTSAPSTTITEYTPIKHEIIDSKLDRNSINSDVENPNLDTSSDDTNICKICFENKNDCVMIECGHLSCLQCASKMPKCAFCRSKIVKIIKIYHV
eukprot:TRINITY_DN5080_c0_g1_i1.p1 TRINITY_DN5080_c0_g1~~TRINITY_DN5080_c0_g1_i1.p1  ORF type:complete len:314 (-),score=27.26 TRINITY_DN5080_c0_g1_i1:62-1003(-)